MSLPRRSLALALLLSPSVALPRPKQSKRHPPDAASPRHAGLPGRYAQRADVRAWAEAQTRSGAALQTWSVDEVLAELAPAQYQRRAAQLMLPAPAGMAKNWTAYRDRFIEPRRLQAGLRFWEQHDAALARAQAQYGVPAELVMGIIGVETFYGQMMGSFRVLDALATLAFDFPRGRSDRSSFFRDELAAFLLLARAEQQPATAFKGSYAGAMGLGQFMPSSWRRWAVDFDGDQHIDLMGSADDAIGSVAHYLQAHGWTQGQPTHLAVEPPADAAEHARLLAPDIEPRWVAADLQALALGQAQQRLVEAHGPWALVQLENGESASPTHVLAMRNFWVVTRYNRSSYYALAVIELGERIGVLRRAGQAS